MRNLCVAVLAVGALGLGGCAFLGEAELFRHQLEGVAGVEGGVDAGVGFAQGDEVTFAGEDHVLAVAVPAGHAQKLGA